MTFSLSSPAFDDMGEIPKKYGYKNKNSNPPLSISDVPPNSKSLALIMDDPDAKKIVGKTWTHWLVWNILPNTDKIDESSIPKGCSQGVSDFGSAKYGGPAPPDKIHTYVFVLYALDTDLNLKKGADAAALRRAMDGHVIGEAKLVGTYVPDS